MNPRQERFAREYAIDLNGTRAAIAAGYSENSAQEQASQLLSKLIVQRKVQRLLSERASRLDIKGERVLEQLANLAFYDVRSLFNADGTMKEITELDDRTAAAISGVEYEKLYEHYAKGQSRPIGNIAKVKLASKLEALKLLGNYLKMFSEQVNVTVTLSDKVREVQERKRAYIEMKAINGNTSAAA